tara:strand:- start:124 stop:1239 length:1116 start_codon:yes stop_codon:yes gene_type:complete
MAQQAASVGPFVLGPTIESINQAERDAEQKYQEFLQSQGRSSTNPYGDAGRFGGGVNFSGIMTPRQIEDVNRLAYNQYLGLVSGRGTQRGGIGDFIPGYAPALKIGSNTPSGRVIPALNQPKQSGILSFLPTFRVLQEIFGGGNKLRALDGGVDYSNEGIETLDVPPLSEPTPGYDELAKQGSGVFTLVSAQPGKTNDLFNLGGFIENLPKTGVGRFVDQVQEKFNMGRGKLVPFFKPNKRQVGVSYKIPIAQQDPQAFARDQALADQDRIQLEYSNAPFFGEDPKGFIGPPRSMSEALARDFAGKYEDLASTARGLTLGDIAGPTKNTDLSDVSDSANLGDPYAGTTGAFVPKKIVITPDGKLIEVPIGF